jgi:hypothetical protein
VNTATAGLRIAKAGAATTGGNSPSNRSPVSGSSAETRGRPGMNLGADMMGDQPDDALAVGGRQPLARIGQPFGEPVDPEPPVGIEHHLDDAGSSSHRGDRRPSAVRSIRAPRRRGI